MLKRFFLNMLSSFVGAWIALVLFVLVAVLVGFGLIAKIGISGTQQASVSKGSILVLDLNGSIIENEIPVQFSYTDIVRGEVSKTQTLLSLRQALAAAKENKNIDALYIKCNGIGASPATLNALRNAILDFRKSGKPVIAYSDTYSMGDYYVATAADDLYLNPCGSVQMQGLGGISLYFKDLLDKLGIKMQVVKVGTYKSAVEPYILEEMSQPARAQLDTLYGNMWNYILSNISQQRKKLSVSKIQSLINNQFIFLKEGPEDLKNGLVDKLFYERSMDSVLAARLNKDKEKLNFVSPELLVSQEMFSEGGNGDEQIAVLFATGEIDDGGGLNSINYEKLVPVITDLAENEDVKGLVLRVNSPGGSVFGSEQIGEALDYFQSKGKPLAVSMGDYAASGGYWISSCADKIFADPLTITGSIGIFGLIPEISGLAKKIGVNPNLVSTNPGAMFPTLFLPLDERQKEAMQMMVEEGYDKFVARVAKGRHLSEAQVRKIGEGRVWDARTAQKIGLVDELGGLQDAVEWIAQKASLSDYNVSYYPTFRNNFWSYLQSVDFIKTKNRVKDILGNDYDAQTIEKIAKLFTLYPLQARMPAIDIVLLDSSHFSFN